MNQYPTTRISNRLLTSIFAFSCVLCCAPSVSSGQGLDDLFSQPSDRMFAGWGEDSQTGPTRVAFLSRPESKPDRFTDEASASQPSDVAVRSASDLRLVDSPGSQPGIHRSSAMELRQARALAESRARIARLEAARWGLRPSLRPTWTADPMTASRFPNAQTYFVPVYVRSR